MGRTVNNKNSYEDIRKILTEIQKNQKEIKETLKNHDDFLKRDRSVSVEGAGDSSLKKEKNFFFSFFEKHKENLGIVGNILQIIVVIVSITVYFTVLKKDLGSMERSFNQRLDILEENITPIWTSLKALSDGTGIEIEEKPSINFEPTSFFSQNIEKISGSYENAYRASIINFEKKSNFVVGEKNNGESVTFDEAKNIPMILSYTENGEDVLFMGQYDSNGKWDGNCVINRYRDNKLTFIMDAEYDSGKLIHYKQAFPFTNSSGKKVWAVSNRKVKEEGSSGYTYTYFMDEAYEKNFSFDSVTEKDILTPDAFVQTAPLILEGYYNGYISDGLFNDDTETAYIVKYDSDGNVTMLYVGAFKDGKLNDETGNAWYIILGHDGVHYYYYKGVFKNNVQATNAGADWQPLTQEEIDDILSGYDFDCDLTGLV